MRAWLIGIEQGEQRGCLVALAECGERHDRPQCGVSVLAAVLTDTRRIALDVARIERCFVEGRCEQQRQAIRRPDQFAFDGGHGACRALGSAAPEITAQD